ncbi:MAG TPA: DUF3047 domain-containing protein [Methylomirabilota bacterium]|nr:DUF3047 domain-containing protein [Methylomirabilota bacterium]
MPRSRSYERLAILAVLLLGTLLAAGVFLSSSPRHRSFYHALFKGRDQPVREEPQSPPPAMTRAPEKSAGPLRSPAAQPPPGEPTERIVVKVVDHAPTKIPALGAPPGWGIKEFAGQARVETVQEGNRFAVRLESQKSSFALYRDVGVSLNDFPVLTWSWKVMKLPQGGDVRGAATDDEAAQVYVIIPRWPHPTTTSEVIGYVWDSRAPVGATLRNPRAGNVRLIVLQSGGEKRGRWITETRNVADDYRALFGKEPATVGRVAVMTDSNDTQSESEALFQDLVFEKRATAPSIPLAD